MFSAERRQRKSVSDAGGITNVVAEQDLSRKAYRECSARKGVSENRLVMPEASLPSAKSSIIHVVWIRIIWPFN